VRVEPIAPRLSEQLRRGGPTWLDSARTGAPFGFAAEVRAAQLARPAGRSRSGDLAHRQAVDARALGERLARDRDLRFVADPPAGYRGVLVELPEPNSNRYAAVIDDRARTIALVPRSVAPERATGRPVEILRNPDGTVVVRRRDLTKDA
jgi:hypothetical protein